MALTLANPNPNIQIVDVIPQASSAETSQNSEPSLAVDPLDPNDITAGVFGKTSTLFYLSIDGGATWSPYGTQSSSDKTMAWTADGSAALTVTLTSNSDISLYSGTTSSGNFGSPIFTYDGVNNTNNIDQPWIRTGPSNHVYIGYNDLGSTSPETASVLVSADGGATFTPVTLDRVVSPATVGQDAPSVRLAVDGSTVYAAFTQWTSTAQKDSAGNEYFNAQVVVVRSDQAGADGFTALGPSGNGVSVSGPITSVFSNRDDSLITLGQERIVGDIAIAVDPNNSQHVVVAYGTAGPIGSGQLQLAVAESTNGGVTWITEYATPLAVRSALPALAIAANGTIGLVYDSYDPTTNDQSQHFLVTNNDFHTTTDSALAIESNASPNIQYEPYIGDFFDLTCVDNTFYGTFCASNADNGTNALFANLSLQRDFAGTPGTSSFALTNTSGSTVSASIDPFFFSFVSALPSPLNVSSVTATPSAGDWGVGKQITITVNFSENATFAGNAPTLSLNDHGVATYQGGSGTNSWNFTYTVGSGDINETALGVTGINLPTGTTVQDSSGNNADFSALPTAFSGLQIDTSLPSVSNVTAFPASGIVAAGSDVTITLAMSEPVTVTNNPVLRLNDGATASYLAGSSTSTSLLFDYHVGTESTTDLQITGIDQSTGTIADMAGNPLSSTLSADLKLETNIFSWGRGVGGEWNTSSDWKPVGVPVAGNTALITTSGTYTVTSSEANSVAILDTQRSVTLAINADAFDITGGTGTGTLAGTITLADAASLGFGAAATSSKFNYTAITTLAAGVDPTDLAISGDVTLSGAGKINLSDSNDQIVSDGTPSSLTNGNATVGTTIAGAGTIGDGDLSFINQAKGIINANSTTGLALAIETASFSNAGLLEAKGHGVLVLDGDIANATTGIVKAAASGAHVDLDGATITGGTISTVSGSSIDSIGGSSKISTNTTLVNAGRLGAEGGDLIVTGPVKSTGTLDANGHLLDLAGPVSGTGKATISNGGTLEFGDAATAVKQAVTFTNIGAGIETLKFDALASSSSTLIYNGTISGFSTANDVIDFAGFTFVGTTNPLHATLSSGNTIITVTEGADQASFKLAGNHLGDTFIVSQDSGTGTQIIDPPALTASADTQTSPLGDADADGHADSRSGIPTSPSFENVDHSGSMKVTGVNGSSLVEIDSDNDQIHLTGAAAATDHDGDVDKASSNSNHGASVSVGDDHFTFTGGADANAGTHASLDAKEHVGDLSHAVGQHLVQELHANITSLALVDSLHHNDGIVPQSWETQFHQIVQASHSILH